MNNINYYDVIKANNYEVDDLLLLHPSVIEDELKKIERKSPIRIVERDGLTQNIFIPNEPIQRDRYTGMMRYYLPQGMVMPVGGLDGKYYLRFLGTRIGKYGFTEEIGYEVIDRNSDTVVFEGKELGYFGRNVTLVDRFYITKNTIGHYENSFSVFEETGYFMSKFSDSKNPIYPVYFLYDAEGNLVPTNYGTYSEVADMALHAPKLPPIEYKSDANVFEQMIISSLKDRRGLEDCTADNLIDIVHYLHEQNWKLAMDLDSLEVYEVNYNRYFNHINKNSEKSQEKRLALKLDGNNTSSN